MQKETPTTVDGYMAGFAPEVQARMTEIRQLIHAAAPGVQEKISWGMATFFIGKRRLHFAGHQKHIGLYPGPEAIEKFASALDGYATSKGGIQLPYVRPLPAALVKDVARFALVG